MPGAGDELRKQILIEMRSDTQGVGDRAANEVRRIKTEMASLNDAFSEGTIESETYRSELGRLTSELQFYVGTVKTAMAATIEADAENARYQARLKEMAGDVAQAVTNQEAWAASLRAGKAAVAEHVQGVNDEIAAEKRLQAELERTMIGLHKLEIDTIRMTDAASAAEDKRLQKVEAAYNRTQAARDKDNVSSANWVLSQVTATDQFIPKIKTLESAWDGQFVALEKVELASVHYAQSQRDAATFADRVTESTREETRMISDAERAMLGLNSVQQKTGLSAKELTAQKNAGAEASKRFGYGVLYASHAIQDLQYGFGAVVNNIPLVVQSLGFGAGLAGTIMVAGVGFSVFEGQIKSAARELGLIRNPANEAAHDIVGLKEKIKALEERPYKLAIDFTRIDDLKKELTLMEKRLQAFEAAKNQNTETADKVAKATKFAFLEEGGSTADQGGVENIAQIIKNIVKDRGDIFQDDRDTPLLGKARTNLIRATTAKEGMDSGKVAMDPEYYSSVTELIKKSKEDIAKFEHDIEQRRTDQIRAMIGSAVEKGDERGIDYVLRFMKDKPGAFTQDDAKRKTKAVGPLFGQMLEESRPKAIEALDEFDRKQEADKQRQEDEIFRRGVKVERQKKIQAADTAMRTAQKIADDELGRKMKEEFEKSVNELMVGKMKPLHGEFEGKANTMAAAGMGHDEIDAKLSKELADRLVKQGAVPGIAIPAAKRLVGKFTEKAFGDIAAQGDVTARQGAMAIDAANKESAAEKHDKLMSRLKGANAATQKKAIKAETGARQAAIGGALARDFGMNAEEAAYAAPRVDKKIQQGMAPRAAAQSVVAEMQKYIQQQQMVILRMQANEEQMAGMFGQASQALQQMQQNNANVSRNMQQGGRPSFMQPFAQR